MKVHAQKIRSDTSHQQITMKSLEPGMYNVIVRNEIGSIIGNSKMMIEKN